MRDIRVLGASLRRYRKHHEPRDDRSAFRKLGNAHANAAIPAHDFEFEIPWRCGWRAWGARSRLGNAALH